MKYRGIGNSEGLPIIREERRSNKSGEYWKEIQERCKGGYTKSERIGR